MKSSASHRHFSATTGMDDEVERQLYHQLCSLTRERIASQKIYLKWIRCLKLEIYSK